MTRAANETMLEIAFNAAASGHDLSGFEMVANANRHQAGYLARCRHCDQIVWVGFSGIVYSRLDVECKAPARWRTRSP